MLTGRQFVIDLIAENGDILFHFQPIFKEGVVICNSYIDEFGDQEEQENSFPFEENTVFNFVLINKPYLLQIFINNQHFVTFIHRTENPDFDYKKIRINGELELNEFQLVS